MMPEHPFQSLFESLGHLPQATAPGVNRQAGEIIEEILRVPVDKPGRCILLRAPRAGHGKTHLLARIQHHLGSTHVFIGLRAAFSGQVDAQTVLDDTLRNLMRPLPAGNGLCALDGVARRLLAMALEGRIAAGLIPCAGDLETSREALKTRPMEVLDFGNGQAATAQWLKAHFESLESHLASDLGSRIERPSPEVAYWLPVLFRFASAPPTDDQRVAELLAESHALVAGHDAMPRVEALLALVTLLNRVVLIADDLDSFVSDPAAALKLASLLGSLRLGIERLDIVLSINEDIWTKAFVPQLSNGLADRLAEVVVELKPLTEDEILALLESRVPGLGKQLWASMDRQAAGTHARGLIQAAGAAWLRATAADASKEPHRDGRQELPAVSSGLAAPEERLARGSEPAGDDDAAAQAKRMIDRFFDPQEPQP